MGDAAYVVVARRVAELGDGPMIITMATVRNVCECGYVDNRGVLRGWRYGAVLNDIQVGFNSEVERVALVERVAQVMNHRLIPTVLTTLPK